MTRQPLVQLIYASQMTDMFTLDGLVRLMEKARAFNRERGITGFLCFGSLRFLQLLEGDPEAVNALYASILTDRRHGGVHLLDYSPIQARSFAQWNMGYVDLDQTMTRAALQGLVTLAPDGDFEPHRLSREQAFFLLKTLAQRAAEATAPAGTARPGRLRRPSPVSEGEDPDRAGAAAAQPPR